MFNCYVSEIGVVVLDAKIKSIPSKFDSSPLKNDGWKTIRLPVGLDGHFSGASCQALGGYPVRELPAPNFSPFSPKKQHRGKVHFSDWNIKINPWTISSSYNKQQSFGNCMVERNNQHI